MINLPLYETSEIDLKHGDRFVAIDLRARLGGSTVSFDLRHLVAEWYWAMISPEDGYLPSSQNYCPETEADAKLGDTRLCQFTNDENTDGLYWRLEWMGVGDGQFNPDELGLCIKKDEYFRILSEAFI
jgi:hypothetical protein